MIDLLNCSEENKSIINNLILTINFFRQFYSSQYEDYFEPQIKDQIEQLSLNFKIQDPIHFILSIFFNLNDIKISRMENLEPFNQFFHSNLFSIFKKLAQLKIANNDTIQELLSAPQTSNLEQFLDYLISNKMTMQHSEIILPIIKTIHLISTDSLSDYLFCLQLLNDLNFLDTQIVSLLGTTNLEQKKLLILYLIETQLIEKDLGQNYFLDIIHFDCEQIYYEILTTISPLFVNDLKNLQIFLLKLLNKPQKSAEYLREITKCLETLKLNGHLNKANALEDIKVSDIEKLNLILNTIDTLPKQAFDDEVCKKTFQILLDSNKNLKLNNFILLCRESELLNDRIQAKTNLLKILNASKNHRIFNKCLEYKPFNGHFNQTKLNILLSSNQFTDSNRIFQVIEILEKNNFYRKLRF